MSGVTRRELKFLINHADAALLKSRLVHFMPRDRHSEKGSYLVRSLYFDDKSNAGFLDKREGMEWRKKYRLRIYDFESREAKFEIKIKANELIDKKSASLSRARAAALVRGDAEALIERSDPVLGQAYYAFKRDRFEPATVVEYRREAFFLDYNHIRVTFDSRVSRSGDVAAFFDPHLVLVPVLGPRSVILEVKYNGFFPGFLSGVMGVSRFERTAMSKYYLSRCIGSGAHASISD